MEKHADTLLLIGRVLLGVIFLSSGVGKLMNLDAFAGSLAKGGVPMPGAMAMLGGMVETLGGLAVVLGVQVRWAAALMILFVIVATLIAHRFWEFAEPARRVQQTQFMKNLSIIGGFLVLLAAGGGRFSLERLWSRDLQKGVRAPT